LLDFSDTQFRQEVLQSAIRVAPETGWGQVQAQTRGTSILTKLTTDLLLNTPAPSAGNRIELRDHAEPGLIFRITGLSLPVSISRSTVLTLMPSSFATSGSGMIRRGEVLTAMIPPTKRTALRLSVNVQVVGGRGSLETSMSPLATLSGKQLSRPSLI
jgi:hypothetical protein